MEQLSDERLELGPSHTGEVKINRMIIIKSRVRLTRVSDCISDVKLVENLK